MHTAVQKHFRAHRQPSQFPWHAALPASPHELLSCFYSVLRNQVRVKTHQPLGCCIFNQRSFALSPPLFGAAAALLVFGASLSLARWFGSGNTAIERA